MGRPAKEGGGHYEWVLRRYGAGPDPLEPVLDLSSVIVLPSVTTIIGDVVAKHALKNWAAKVTREGVAALFNEGKIESFDHEKSLYGALKDAGWTPDQKRDERSAEGTAVHEYLTTLARSDKAVAPSNLFETGILDWWLSFKPDPTAVDEVVWSLEHGFCGTLDLEAEVETPDGERRTYLIDLKSRKPGDRNTAYGSEHLQTAAYWLARGADPNVGTAALIVNGDGNYAWHPGNPARDAQAFLHVLEVFKWITDKEAR